MQRIFTEQLGSALQNKLAKLYYFVGQDPLLLSENQDRINQYAFKQGFDEKMSSQLIRIRIGLISLNVANPLACFSINRFCFLIYRTTSVQVYKLVYKN